MKRAMRAVALVCALAMGGAFAHAQTTERVVRVTMPEGDTVTGVLIDQAEDGAVTLRHPVFGIVTIPGDRVSTVTTEAGLTPDDLNFTPEAAEQPVPEEEAPEPPVEEESPWSVSIGFGFNGATGNSETIDFRGGLGIRKETDEEIFSFVSDYKLSQESGEDTENRWFNEAIQEWLAPDTPWTYFARATFEIDRFKGYDERFAAQTGVGYRFIDTERTLFAGRVGPGVAREWGGQRDDWYAELLASLELRHEIDDRSRFVAFGEYIADLEEYPDFRSRVGGSYEIDIDNNGDWALRLGVEHRYESNPGDAERIDVDYFATLRYDF